MTHVPGRGRDRRRRRGARRGVRRRARRHHDLRARASRSRPRRSAWRVSLELPLVVVDVQRGGPSTGLPTKTEQADLLQAMFGRNGESPVPIVAPRSPADCFDTALEAVRIATTYRTPVHPAVRRLPRQRLRAVADPGRSPTCPTCASSSPPSPTASTTRATRSSTPTCATPRRWPGRGRSPARRAWSTASAASRRPTSPATSPTTPPTTT